MGPLKTTVFRGFDPQGRTDSSLYRSKISILQGTSKNPPFLDIEVFRSSLEPVDAALSALEQINKVLANEAGTDAIIWFAFNSADQSLNHVAHVKEKPDSCSIVNKYDLKLETVYDASREKAVSFDELVQHVAIVTRKDREECRDILANDLNKIDASELPRIIPQYLPVYKGRYLNESDKYTHNSIITANKNTLQAGLEPGDVLVYRSGKGDSIETIEFTTVGMIDRCDAAISVGIVNPHYISTDTFAANSSFHPGNIGAGFNLDPDHSNDVKTLFSDLPGVFIRQINLLSKFVGTLVVRFSKLPVIISLIAMIIQMSVLSVH